MEKSKVRKVLGVSINPYLYEKLKAECDGKNVSAFVERAITKELEEKAKERKSFKQELIKGYQKVAKSQKRQAEDEI
jgi:post-segregation antitoxin (ccd killing protein)